MTQEEAGSVILEIFQRHSRKSGEFLSNKDLHDEFFKKTQSGLGFFDGVKFLLEHKWLAPAEGQENCHKLTKSGLRAEI